MAFSRTNQAQCLNLVTNAVVLWNTVYMSAALDELRAAGHRFTDDDVVHLSPARFEHFNPYGRYHFDPELAKSKGPFAPSVGPDQDRLLSPVCYRNPMLRRALR